jgi:hypothetical protein
MKHLVIVMIFVLVYSTTALAQSKVVAVSSSALAGIELPAGSKQDKRLLVTATAQAVLQLAAEEKGIVLSDNIEVLTLPSAIGNEVIEQFKSAATKAGWQINELTGQPNYWLLVKSSGSLLIYLASTKRDTQLYLSPVIGSNELRVSNIPAEKNASLPSTTTEDRQPVKALPTDKPVIAPTADTQKNTFAFTSTDFDDGWVSTIANDYVKVTKGTTEVYLYYPEDFSSTYSGKIEPEDYYWNTLIARRFTTYNAARWVEVTYPPIHFMEGDATEKQTGKNCFLAMSVVFNNGGATVILIVTPSKSAHYELFQHPRGMEKMLNYNKFAVGASDLVGKWAENSGSSVSLYNTYTGNYAGSNYASSAHSFVFNSNGTYTSKHSGASSVYGSNTYYSQEYSGKIITTNWEVSMTNRWKDKTENFNAQFEVIRGGRVLHLQDKEASGITYHLVRLE